MNAILSMAIAALIWSLYPLAAVQGMDTMSGLSLVVVSTFFAAIGSAILLVFYFPSKNKLKALIDHQKSLSRSSYLHIFASAAAHVLCHGLFFTALSLSHKGGASLIYESWPIIALIATPLMIKKDWQAVGLHEFITALIAMVGVIIIVLSNDKIELPFGSSKDLNARVNYSVLLGYILAFVGGYACAMNIIYKAIVAQEYRPIASKMGVTLISEFYSRVVGLLLVVILYPFLSEYIDLSQISWGAAAFIGLVVMVLGGAIYTYSILNARSPTIHVMYYMVPVFAVLFLWMAGETTITTGLFIGGAIIISCNIYLYFAAKKQKYLSQK